MARRSRARPITKGHQLRNVRVNAVQLAEGTAVRRYCGKPTSTKKEEASAEEKPKKIQLSQGSAATGKRHKPVDQRPYEVRKPHPCPLCKKRFATAAGLAQHTDSVHPTEEERVESRGPVVQSVGVAAKAAPAERAPAITRFAGSSASDTPADQHRWAHRWTTLAAHFLGDTFRPKPGVKLAKPDPDMVRVLLETIRVVRPVPPEWLTIPFRDVEEACLAKCEGCSSQSNNQSLRQQLDLLLAVGPERTTRARLAGYYRPGRGPLRPLHVQHAFVTIVVGKLR